MFAVPPAELLDKGGDRIRRMFGQIAPWYDFLNHLLSLNVDKVWRRRTTRLVPPGPAAAVPVLDLCTGTGDLALAYDRAAKGAVPVALGRRAEKRPDRACDENPLAGAAIL